MKRIIAVWHADEKDKTETLRDFSKLLLEHYTDCTLLYPDNLDQIPDDGDFRLVIQINHKIIGIETHGDQETDLTKGLIELADKYKCETILCSSRTRNETIKAVDNLFHNRSYRTIWTSTYKVEDAEEQEIVNNLKAKHLLELIKDQLSFRN